MRALLLSALIAVALACKDSTGPLPLPSGILPGDGVLRFVLSDNCTTQTLVFRIGNDYLNGPSTLAPGAGQDYERPANTVITAAKEVEGPRVFADETLTIVAGARVTRTLRC